MAKADADRTSSIGDDDESMGPSCPICLISSESVRDDDDDDAAGGTHDDDDDNDDDYVTTAFVRTPCEHVFCMSCMERVLLRKPTNRRGGGGWRVVPTLGPCPMCRELVSLFDLRLEATATVDGGPSSSLYGGELEVSSWPVAGSRYRQRVLLPIEDPRSLLRELINRKGPIEGCGIEFRFRDPAPTFRILEEDDVDDDEEEVGEEGRNEDRRSRSTVNGTTTIAFDKYHFHRESMTFMGFARFAHRPIRSKLEGRRYDALVCTLNFSDDGRYIRVGDLNWRHWPPNENDDDEEDADEVIRVDDTDRWRSVEVDVGALVYQRFYDAGRSPSGGEDGPPSLSGPSYRSDTVWGNTYCQGLCVGMASYHFLEGGDNNDGGGEFRAYISYESPRTEMWPSLDNGDSVPSRVHFRDIRWEVDTRTFRGDICWEIDYGTTWMNESRWSYEMKFDPTYAFVESGTVVRSTGEPPHRFGIDLIYINAALETHLREDLQRGARTVDYLNIVRQWRDCNASSATLDMLGEVAMNVLDERDGMIDFNL